MGVHDKKPDNSETRKFIYEIGLRGPRHSPKTIKNIFGKKGHFNPDFREDCWVSENLYEVFKDAISHTFMMQMDHMARNKVKNPDKDDFCKYMERKREFYQELQATITLARVENADSDAKAAIC